VDGDHTKDINTFVSKEGIAASPTSPDAEAFRPGRQPLEHGRSTFHGSPVRGGWIPILSTSKYGKPHITDWICPKCTTLVGQSRSCPHCGLLVMERPLKYREEHNHRAWAKWGNNLFDDDEVPSLRRRKALK
jgi:hypothetical protein